MSAYGRGTTDPSTPFHEPMKKFVYLKYARIPRFDTMLAMSHRLRTAGSELAAIFAAAT